MYRYDEFDAQFVRQRVAQFRDQVARRVSGELNEDEFKALRLRNGVYLQLHAYMLRIAIPYGTLSPRQMRKLAHIARTYDRGYGHFTTRQNLQFNWPRLSDIPDILDELADVEMHAIQTSGNCIRNVTADHFAGASADEVADPRPYAEIVRQWSSLHPEFSFLPRKFKVAVIASEHDRAAMKLHDIGLHLKPLAGGGLGFAVWVGGGMGRTPIIAKLIRDDLPEEDLLSYLEAVLRVYNLHGRRDNIYKARIKILVDALGLEVFAAQVEEEWQRIRDGALKLPEEEIRRIRAYFAPPAFEPASEGRLAAKAAIRAPLPQDGRDFDRWVTRNTHAHRQPGYAIVTISLKPIGGIPGDASADQMDAIADLAERYSFDEVRVTHEQNLVLPHVRLGDLPEVYQALKAIGLAEANAGLVTDIIACPGLDYCALANARSIPIAQRISERLAARQDAIGDLKIKISGCINACGHHHVGHIGILGVEKRGEEHYQLLLGGSGAEDAAIGQISGPGFGPDGIVDAVEKVVERYLELRKGPDEPFLTAYNRLGDAPFKEALYAA
jgi:sulfite reductase (NADPH) hemoprotein beta-component